MKLQLLIPQFNETDEVMRPMLESISTQQGVDLKNDIEVLIGNDGFRAHGSRPASLDTTAA